MNEEEFMDEDYKDIAASENETDLITKLNSPINILLISLIIGVIIMILVVWFVF